MPAEAKPPARPPAGGRGHILVVDDQPDVLKIVTRLLERLGYSVTACPGGEEALVWYREHGDEADLVLLDERMPRLSGTATFAKLREMHPDVRVIVMSGFTDEGVINSLLERGVLDFVSKPCKTSDLADTLARWIGKDKD